MKKNILLFKLGFNYNPNQIKRPTYIYEQIKYIGNILSKKYNVYIIYFNIADENEEIIIDNVVYINIYHYIKNSLDFSDFLKKYDKVIIINSTINIFGGYFPNYKNDYDFYRHSKKNIIQIIHLLLLNYISKNEKLNNNCFYIFDDTKLDFKYYNKYIIKLIRNYNKDSNLENKIAEKIKYYENNNKKNETYYYYLIINKLIDNIIKNNDINILKINIIGFIRNFNKINKKFNNKNIKYILYNKLFYFPIEKIILYYWNGERKIYKNQENIKDIIYAGNYRNGERTNSIIKYLFDNKSINAEIIGYNIHRIINDYKKKYNKEPNNIPVIINKLLSYKDYLNYTSNSNFIATLNIAEKNKLRYNCIPPRIFDSILNGNITLIDCNTINVDKIFIKNKDLLNFLYIKNKNDLNKKIKILRNNEEKINNILNTQYDIIENIFVKEDYCNWLFSILESIEKKLINISENNIYIIKEKNYNNITIDDIKKIEYYRLSYILKNKFNKNYLFYPGFMFNNHNDANLYFDIFYSNIMNINVAPRGSLANNIIIIGYASNNENTDNYKISSWLLGENSKLLHNLLIELKLYPYFTDIYKGKSIYNNNNFYLDLLEIELNAINNIIKNPIFICLGDYEIFDKISELYKIKINKVYCPNYLIKNDVNINNFNNSKLYNEWKNNFIKIINN